MHSAEAPKIRKESATLTNPAFNTPNTSLVMFHFEPHTYPSTEAHLKRSSIAQHTIQGKELYIFEDFFKKEEGDETRLFSEQAQFSKAIYADQTSKEQGEEPARAMDNREKWMFFAKPPESIKELYRLLSSFGEYAGCDIATLPWDLNDGHITASAIATNRIERLSNESMHLGAHEDYNTEKGVPFAIPVLYSKEGAIHPKSFVNGAAGRPWFVSLMFYATAANFKPEFGLGTVFFEKKDVIATQSNCTHMSFVLFEGDIIHGIQESRVPADTKTWRVSYVFKLLMNPLNEGQCIKQQFHDWLKSYKLQEK